MDVNLSFGQYNNFCLNESRLSMMIQADEKGATHISLWDKIKDLFRADKKEDACRELFNLLHSTDSCDVLDSFNKLKSLANPSCSTLFRKEIYCDEVVFSIGDAEMGRAGLPRLMSLAEHTPLSPMSLPEQRIFLDMLDTIREKNCLFSDTRAGHLRTLMSDEHCHDILNLYRPEEHIDAPGTQWNNPENLDYKEKNLLIDLNRGSMKPLSEFSFMGYQKNMSGVEFSMLHPSINYLLSSYTLSHEEHSSTTELNTSYLKVLNKTYQDYHDKKTEIDCVLNKIYDAHGGTLNIAHHTRNNNQLVNSPYAELSYVIQPDDFNSDLSRSLDSVFRKWAAEGEKPR